MFLQSVSSGLSLEPPATTEPDEEEDGMSDIVQEVNKFINMFIFFLLVVCSVEKIQIFMSSSH